MQRPGSIPADPAPPRWRRHRSRSVPQAAAGPVERDAPVAQADECVVADDEVVQHRHVQQPAGSDRLGRQVEIVRAGRRVARGVVVDHDDARCVAPDGVPEQFPDPHQRRRHVALVDALDGQHRVLG